MNEAWKSGDVLQGNRVSRVSESALHANPRRQQRIFFDSQRAQRFARGTSRLPITMPETLQKPPSTMPVVVSMSASKVGETRAKAPTRVATAPKRIITTARLVERVAVEVLTSPRPTASQSPGPVASSPPAPRATPLRTPQNRVPSSASRDATRTPVEDTFQDTDAEVCTPDVIFSASAAPVHHAAAPVETEARIGTRDFTTVILTSVLVSVGIFYVLASAGLGPL